LKDKGARVDRVRQRQQEEARQQRALLRVLPVPDGRPLPEGLTHPTAVAFWAETTREFTFDAQALALFRQGVFSLQSAELAREEVAAEGLSSIDQAGRRAAHPSVKTELEHRRLFAQLCRQLGFLKE
jgi:hypothetical protein